MERTRPVRTRWGRWQAIGARDVEPHRRERRPVAPSCGPKGSATPTARVRRPFRRQYARARLALGSRPTEPSEHQKKGRPGISRVPKGPVFRQSDAATVYRIGRRCSVPRNGDRGLSVSRPRPGIPPMRSVLINRENFSKRRARGAGTGEPKQASAARPLAAGRRPALATYGGTPTRLRAACSAKLRARPGCPLFRR
jgi:hypothetical protein